MTANLTHYEFCLPSDEDSNSSEPNNTAEKNLTKQKAESAVEELTSTQDTDRTTKRKTYFELPNVDVEETSCVPDTPKEAAMENNSNVPESDKTNELDVLKLKYISPTKADGSGGLDSDVCDSKAKVSQPESSAVRPCAKAKIPSVIDANELLSHESQDHEDKILEDDDENTKLETAKHGALLNNSADETMSELPSSLTKIDEAAGKDESVVEHSKSSDVEEPVTKQIKSKKFEKAPQQNGPSDNQNDSLSKPLESVNSGENMEMEVTVEPSIDVSMGESCDENMPEAISAANLPDQSAKNCNQALQEFIRQNGNDQDSSSENSESEAPSKGFIDEMAEEGEEDTPSEDSNAIPDRGESIGSSDSEPVDSPDEYRCSDSFICDDEEDDLLSGNEYDLGNERKSKKSRIIDVDLLGDNDITKIPIKKVEEELKKRKRIVETYDLSGDDEKAQHSPPIASSQSKETSTVSINENPPVGAEETNHCVQEEITEEAKETHKNSHLADVVIGNVSIISTISDIQKTCKNSFISIHQNIQVGEKSTEKINTLVKEFCSAVKDGKIYLNICHGCDDLANLALSNSLIKGKVKQVIETENDSPNSAKSNADVSGVKNSPNSKSKSKDDVTGVKKKKKKKRKQKSKKITTELSEDQSTAENLDRQLVKVVNGRDAESKQKRARLKRKLTESNSESSEKNQVTEHRKKKPKKTSSFTSELFKKQVADLKTKICRMDRLVTDVKNRPRRAIKPSTSSANESWIETDVSNVPPSTSLLSEKRVRKKGTRRIKKPDANQTRAQ